MTPNQAQPIHVFLAGDVMTGWIGHGMDTQLALYVAALFVASLLVAAGAYLYSVRAQIAGLAAMVIGTAALVVGAIMDLPAWTSVSWSGATGWNELGIGLFLLPAAAVALIAAIADVVELPQLHRPAAPRPI